MPLYALDGNKKLRLIAEQPIRLETEIHAVVEANLNQLFGLQMVAHEFTVQNVTLDTVAFDEEVRAFVILEYKRDEGGSVIDQGYAYLATMLNNRAEFILKYTEASGKHLTKNQVDWGQSRVLFVAQRFKPHQVMAINFKDLPIELWRFSRFENGTLLFEQVKPTATAASVKPLMRGREAQTIQREIQVYNPEDFLQKVPERLRSLFQEFESAVRSALSDVELSGRKWGLTFKRRWAGVCFINFRKGEIRLDLRIPSVPSSNPLAEKRAVQQSDPYKVVARIKKLEDVRHAVELVRMAYQEAGKALGESAAKARASA